MKDKPFIIFFALVLSCHASSQQVFEHISSAQGLTSGKVADIIQDKEGFYWIATSEGLNRFDGSTFKVYRHDKNDSASLSHNNCTSLLEDNNGDIWIGTAQGVTRFIKKQGIFKRFYFHNKDVNDNLLNYVMGLISDGKENIWIAAFGLWKINTKNESVKGYGYEEKDSSTISDASQCLRISFDKKQNGLWIATSYHINFFNFSTEKFYHRRHNPFKWTVFTWANRWPWFTSDKEGNVWFYDRHEKKLYLYDSNKSDYEFSTLSFQHAIAMFSNDNNGNLLFSMEPQHGIFFNWKTKKMDTLMYSVQEPEQATNYKINQYYKDRDDNIWLCTLNGLFVAKNGHQRYKVYSFGNNEFGLPVAINAMVIRKGVGWLGIGNVLYEYNFNEKSSIPVFKYPSTDGFRPLLNDGDSVLWLFTLNRVIRFDFKTKKIRSETELDGSPYFLTKDSYNRFWVGTWNAGFYKMDSQGEILEHYTKEKGLKNLDLISCFSDGKNSLWIGFNGGAGFTRFDLKTETFENFTVKSAHQISPQINSINAIVADRSNNLWLGTYGGGVYYFDRQKNIFTNYSVQDGLSGDYINTLSLDSKDNLWVSTINGIDIMNIQNHNIYHLNEAMKFGSTDHIDNIARVRTDSFFYFATNKILAIETQLYQGEHSDPAILVSGFKVLNKEYPQPATISSVTLSHKRNFFTIDFSVLKVSPSIPANYKYKLEGFDEDWIMAGNRGIANYTNVPPGKYRLLLSATDEIGRWKSDPKSILIIIRPPFWKTWWFVTLASVLILSSLYFFYRYRIAQVKKLYSLRSKISQDLHDEVASTLSGIRLYSEMAKQQLQNQNTEGTQRSLNVISSNANDMAQDMSDIIWAINPLNDSFKKLLQKLKGYALEISTAANIKFDYTIADHIPEEKLSMQQRRNVYLICKEAINNAVKYSGGKNLMMNVESENHSVKIKIQDDGTGFDKTFDNGGNGLLNMKVRAKEINAGLEITTQSEKGTLIELTVKL